MKFTIEVEDFYLDEEDIESGLKRAIINDVVQKIQKTIADRVEKQVDTEVRRRVEESLYTHITACIKETIATGTVKGKYGSGEPMTMADYVQFQFSNNDAVRGINEQVKAVAVGLANAMKQRYDMLFASQIVAKMNTNGFLKEDIGKLLLQEGEAPLPF